ncbi:MAG: YicC family protein [Spirochaetes bacterium GWB1_48_6]|nr:MAG: YicC family protein [Spirochaetes bacterium GWB1_48_6]
MISMTGFSSLEDTSGRYRFSIEVKALNNRYLDLFINLPPALSSREGVLRSLVQEKIQRGRVELTIRLKEIQEELRIKVNESAAAQALASLKALKKASGLRGSLKMEHLLSVEGLVNVEKTSDAPGLWENLLPRCHEALDKFNASRKNEGSRLESDIRLQLDTIAAGRLWIESQSAVLEAQLRENLQKRLKDLAAEVDESRMHSEIALLLVRYSINEELVRLGSHLDSFHEIIQAGGPVGKKLDFLCQELGREINTIGSKTTSSEVQHRVVNLKDALENIREQLRNVE